MAEQAKGSAGRIIIDTEASCKTPKTGAARTPINVAFNSCDVRLTRPLNQAETLHGDRNPTDPNQGNKNVGGNLVIPVDPNILGYFLKYAIGIPTVIEVPIGGSNGSDIKAQATSTINIAGGTGGYTFSTAQTAAVVGDRVIYEKLGVRHVGYITTKTSDTVGVLQTQKSGGVACTDLAGASVIAIMQNKADTPDRRVTISSGIATFDQAPANLASGQMLIYVDTSAEKYAWVKAVTSTTTATVVAASGFAPPDCSTKLVTWLGKASKWKHTYKIDPKASLPSFILERGFLDLASPKYQQYIGCKVNTFEISVGGDGELVATLGILGADRSNEATAYDAAVGAPAAIDLYNERFQMFDASATEGGTEVEVLQDFKLKLDNKIDSNKYRIGGQGARAFLPEGIAEVSGSISAFFTDDAILTKAQNNTKSSLGVTFTNGDDSLAITIPELKYSEKDPAITGPAGVMLDLDFEGFKATSIEASAIIAELTTSRAAF